MSPSTVTRIVSELIERGILVEMGLEESSGGRKPITLRLNHAQLFVLGGQLLRDQSGVALANLRGEILARRLFRPYSLQPKALIEELAQEVHHLLEREGIDRDHIVGFGLAASGIVDSEQASILRSVNLGWENTAIGADLESLVDLPTFVENDANAAAMAEMWFGAARGVENFMYVKTGSGVGAALVYRGRLVRGGSNMAGEIGHIPLVKNGRRCRCGQAGCLETYFYVPDVLERYEVESGEAIDSIEHLFEKYDQGDATAMTLVEEAAHALALHVAFSAVLLDLDLVIIGGSWGASKVLLDRVESFLRSVLDRSGLAKSARILGSPFGDDADIRGAVGLVIDRLFSHPLLV